MGNKRRKGRGTQCGQWLRREPPHRGNCAAMMSVRSAVAVRPEQDEATVPPSVSSSYPQSWGRSQSLLSAPTAECRECEARQPAPPVKSRRGKSFRDTVLGLADTSWRWDFREFRVCRDKGFCGKGIRDAVVGPVPPPCINLWNRGLATWVGIPGETHRALPWVRITGCWRRIIHSALAAVPSWALRGEKLQSFGAGPGGQGSRSQVSRQWKHWKSRTTHSVSGPDRPAARLSGQCRPNHLPGLRWDLTGICQPARAPPPTAPGRYFRHSPNDNTRRSRHSNSSLARRLLNSWNAFKRQLSCAPRSRPRSGSVSGGRVRPWSSSIATSSSKMRSRLDTHAEPLPRAGRPSHRSRYSFTSGQVSP